MTAITCVHRLKGTVSRKCRMFIRDDNPSTTEAFFTPTGEGMLESKFSWTRKPGEGIMSPKKRIDLVSKQINIAYSFKKHHLRRLPDPYPQGS